MKTFKTTYFHVTGRVSCGIAAALMALATFTSCEDFFDQESDHVIYVENDAMNNWSDTVYNVTGILSKLQVVADRTILLGELRGDLVSLTSTADADLREIASFNVSDDNVYNEPGDYYAIINNCNYFIAKADTALRSNRDEYIFLKEYAAVKAIRAWTYLQLALNYGSVPFVVEPILTKEQSELDYPRYDLAAICEYFINDLNDLPASFDVNQYPDYGDKLRSNNSRFFFFPINIMRAELNLWLGSTKGKGAGKSNFEQAVYYYCKYISERNGDNSAYPNGADLYMWAPGSTSWLSHLGINSITSQFSDETYNNRSELITMIAGDSIRAEGNYSELRNLFNSTDDNNYKVSIVPSARIIELSESQPNCCLSSNGKSVIYAPSGLADHESGDLRLSMFWRESYTFDRTTGDRIETQQIRKYSTRNVHIYRRQMLYLHLAEALNNAGQPRVAFKILQRGLSQKIFEDEVYPLCNESDSTWIDTYLKFPDSRFEVLEAEDITGTGRLANRNMVGIHSRGCGWTPMNEYYKLVADTVETDPAKYEQVKLEQQAQVERLLLDEAALETAFEGVRFYDLMRFAMRQDNPGEFMKEHVYARRGKANAATVQGEIQKDLGNMQNWYLTWKGMTK